MVAHLADDERMIEAFRKGEDIHTRTACEVYDVSPENVTPIMRRHAKALNFGIVYGMGATSFARTAGLTREEAAGFISRYFSEFSGVAKYMEDTKAKARAQGYVETLFGHRRLMPELASGIPQVRAQGERMAINMPVQGTAADVVKMAMINVYTYCQEKGYKESVRMILQIHDELVFEVKKELVAEVIPKLKHIMESVYDFKVPLVVEAKHGPNLLDMADRIE
jgi:DNA polymerase-1